MAPKPEVNVLIKARDLASQVFGRFQRTVRSVTRTVQNVARGLGIFGAASAAAVEGLRRLQSEGASVVAVKRAFAKVTDDETAALQRLRDAAQNTVSDFDLMRLANQALALGAVDTAEGFATMVRQARLLGRAQGIEAADALEKYTVGLARQSKLRLDDLGITLSQEEANLAYAESVGKSVDQLNDAEKATAFRTEAMRKAEELVGELTTGELGAVAAGDKLATTVSNIRARLVELVALSPRVSSFFEGLSFFLEDISGQDVAVDAILQGLNRIDDLRVLQHRMLALSRERQEIQPELADLEGRFEARRGRIMGFEAEFRRLQELRQRMDEIDAVLPVLGRRITTIAGSEGAPTEEEVAVTPSGGAGIEGTEANLRGLLAALRDTQGALDEARLDQALASPGEEAEKSKKKVEELASRLEHLKRLVEDFGGLGAIQVELGVSPLTPGEGLLAPERLLLNQGDFFQREGEGNTEAQRNRDQGRRLAPFGATLDPIKDIREGTKALDEGAESFEGTAQVAAASFFSMAEAAARGSDQVASSVVSMISNILQSIPGVGGFAGAVIGGVGGLVSAALGRRNDPVPVRLQDVDDRAARKLNQADQRPVRIVTIVEQEGVEIERIERELFARQDRDEVVRFSSGSPLVR